MRAVASTTAGEMVETERRATRAIRAKEVAAESGDGILVIDVFVGMMGA